MWGALHTESAPWTIIPGVARLAAGVRLSAVHTQRAGARCCAWQQLLPCRAGGSDGSIPRTVVPGWAGETLQPVWVVQLESCLAPSVTRGEYTAYVQHPRSADTVLYSHRAISGGTTVGGHSKAFSEASTGHQWSQVQSWPALWKPARLTQPAVETSVSQGQTTEAFVWLRVQAHTGSLAGGQIGRCRLPRGARHAVPGAGAIVPRVAGQKMVPPRLVIPSYGCTDSKRRCSSSRDSVRVVVTAHLVRPAFAERPGWTLPALASTVGQHDSGSGRAQTRTARYCSWRHQ